MQSKELFLAVWLDLLKQEKANLIILTVTSATVTVIHFGLTPHAMFPGDTQVTIPSLSQGFVFFVIPFGAYWLTRYVSSSNPIGLATGLGFLLVAAAGYDQVPTLFAYTVSYAEASAPLLVYFVLIGTYLAFSLARGEVKLERQTLASGAFLGVFAIALVHRWDMLLIYQSSELDPDAITYRRIADDMVHVFDTGFREPLWIWVIKLWFLIVGSADLHLRLLTVFLSLGAIYGSYRFVLAFTRNEILALLTSLMLAVNDYLVYMSVRGLRLELYMIVILVFAYYVLVRDRSITERHRVVGLSLGFALTQLLRLNSFIFLLPLTGYAVWKHKLPWKSAAVPVLTAPILISPYLAYSQAEFGDPLYSTNIHAKWWRNQEFVQIKGTGCEGCPTLEALKENSYAGKPVTSTEYVFGMHGLWEVVSRTSKGYVILFVQHSQLLTRQIGQASSLAYVAYLVGFIMLILSRYRDLLLFPVLTINFMAFLIPLGIDSRLVQHTAPFTTFIMVFPLWCVWRGFLLVRSQLPHEKNVVNR